MNGSWLRILSLGHMLRCCAPCPPTCIPSHSVIKSAYKLYKNSLAAFSEPEARPRRWGRPGDEYSSTEPVHRQAGGGLFPSTFSTSSGQHTLFGPPGSRRDRVCCDQPARYGAGEGCLRGQPLPRGVGTARPTRDQHPGPEHYRFRALRPAAAHSLGADPQPIPQTEHRPAAGGGGAGGRPP